jgi:hypothetical protein
VKALYVIGGQQRFIRPLIQTTAYWYEYEQALILRVDLETGHIQTCVEYVSPPDVCPDQNPAILFKSGTLDGNRLYVTTQTEVVIYEVPSFKRVGYVSLPCFNDVHHVRPTPEGHLLIANSGLDMVLETTMEGEILRMWNVLGEDPWARFSPDIDYRKVASTKPHRSHPNHVFYVDGEPWVTRFQQKDAISLTHPERRIALDVEKVHDGVVYGDRIYFTTVNGNVLIASTGTLQVEETIDLNTIQNNDMILGWCRSVLVDDQDAWIGFSRIRPTKIRENVGWIVHGFKRGMPTHIAQYDLEARRCLREINLEAHKMGAVFGIFPAL